MDTSSDEFTQAVEDAVAAAVAGLKTKNSDLIGDKKSLSTQLKEAQGQIVEFAEADEQRNRKAATKKGDWEKLEKDLRDQQLKELEVRDSRLKVMETSLRSEILEKRAVEAISELGGSTRVLKPHVLGAMSVIEDDGRFVAVILDEKGAPRLSADAKTATDYMTVNEYVESLKNDPEFAGVFSGTGAGGGGATASQSTGGKAGPKTVDRNDPVAMGKLAAKIATGEVEVI